MCSCAAVLEVNGADGAGAVAVTEHGRLRAKMRYYSPAAPDQEAVLRSGSVLEDLGATVAENLVRAEERTRFEGRATN